MIGTWINTAAILVGGTIGLLAGEQIPNRLRRVVTLVIGLITLVLGVRLAIGTANLLVLLLATLTGGLVGTALRIEERIETAGDAIKRRFPRLARGAIGEALVTSAVLFCVGPLTIIGALRDGLYGDWQLLGLKSVLDGISSIVLAAGLGSGVLLSAAVVLVVQGGISIGARLLAGGEVLATLDGSPILGELDAAGGIILIALAFKLLEIRDLRPGNLLPAILAAPLFAWIAELLSR